MKSTKNTRWSFWHLKVITTFLLVLFLTVDGHTQGVADLRRIEQPLESARMNIAFTESTPDSSSKKLEAEIQVITRKGQVFIREYKNHEHGIPDQSSDGKRYVLLVKASKYASVTKDSKIPSPSSLVWLVEPNSANCFLTGRGLSQLRDVRFAKNAHNETVVSGLTQEGYTVTAIVDPKADYVAKKITVNQGRAESTFELGPPMRANNCPYIASSCLYRLKIKGGRLIREWKGKIVSVECGNLLGTDFHVVIPAGWKVNHGPSGVMLPPLAKDSTLDEVDQLAKKQKDLEEKLADQNLKTEKQRSEGKNVSWVAVVVGVLLVCFAAFSFARRKESKQ